MSIDNIFREREDFTMMANRWTSWFLALVIGVLIGAPIGAALATFYLPKQSTDLLGFWGAIAGSLLGGAMTIIAGIMAYSAAMASVRGAESQKTADQQARIDVAVSYCKGVKEAARIFLDHGNEFLRPRTPQEKVNTDGQLRKKALSLMSEIKDECLVVEWGDVESILHKLPMETWRKLRRLKIDEAAISKEAMAVAEDMIRFDYVYLPVRKSEYILKRMPDICNFAS